MKAMNKKSFAALAALAALLVSAQIQQAKAAEQETAATVGEVSSDARTDLDLDKLTNADELDQSLDVDGAETENFIPGRPVIVRPRPVFPRPIVRPVFPRPIYRPVFPRPIYRPVLQFITCYAENSYGRVFWARNNTIASIVQSNAVNACLRSDAPYGCRPTGCR
jgi:hypothetical protein